MCSTNHPQGYRMTLVAWVTLAVSLLAAGIAECQGTTNEAPASPLDVATTTSTRATRTVRDMVGRVVPIPQDVKKAFATSAVGTVFLYTLAPEKMVGWTNPLGEEELGFIAEPYRQLPVLGSWFGKGNTSSLEELLRVGPDVVLSMGTTDDYSVSLSEHLQQQAHIPVLLVDGRLDQTAEAYEFVGRVLGAEERAEKLAHYCRDTLAEIRRITVAIPENARVRIYYAEGPDGLETDPRGSLHAEIFDIVGAVNVADIRSAGGKGRVRVSFEQLLAWNPDVIIIGFERGEEFGVSPELLANHPVWGNLDAVKNKRVYTTPHLPFNWLDRPPSVNRLIGLRWLATILYPEKCSWEMREETRRFYADFYHVQLTDAQVTKILQSALPTSGKNTNAQR